MALFTGTAAALGAGTALKALIAKLGMGAAKTAATKGGGALVKSLAAKGAGAGAKQGFFGQAKRFAGDAFKDYMGPGGITPQNLAVNFGLDAGFGVMQGLATPGDIGDKLIAGVTSGVGGAAGGVLATGALGKFKNNPALRIASEFGGGYAGDMGGQVVGDSLMRLKGGGTTPWEKVQQSQDQEYRQQLEREILAQYGLGGYQPTDLFLRDNGLA